MKKLLACCFLLLAVSNSLIAQTEERKWNIGLHGGLNQYNGDIGQGFYDFDQAAYAFGGISISRYLGPYMDLNLYGTMGETGFIELGNTNNRFRASMTTGVLNFRLNMFNPDAAVRPYIFAGVGVMYYPEKYTILKAVTNFALPDFGGGFNFRLGEVVNLQIQETFYYTDDDEIDGEVKEANDGFLQHTIGLTFNMGKCEDVDADGVCDKKDKCLNTPKGVTVDKEGCPVDTDKDGTADYLDECPSVAGVASLKGCPDKDADGIADKADACPDVKGLANLAGCPDTDADGVADKDDKCPQTTTGYKVDNMGCPFDNDKDGLVNEEDRCPDIAGTIALKGCPDTDADGVADIDDLCPTKPGNIANKGCPEIAPEDVKKINKIASSIYFETGSNKLKKSSIAQLNTLVDLMNKYEGAKLTIDGHSDSQGNDDFNMTLSQKRVDAVKTYLMSKGILESRLTATGYGETKPIADNKTSAGRAKNRRVELKAEY